MSRLSYYKYKIAGYFNERIAVKRELKFLTSH